MKVNFETENKASGITRGLPERHGVTRCFQSLAHVAVPCYAAMRQTLTISMSEIGSRFARCIEFFLVPTHMRTLKRSASFHYF